MKSRNIHRLVVAILGFVVGTGIVYFCGWCIAGNARAQISPFHDELNHSAENNSAYSILEGTTIRIKPYDATFEIPEDWLRLKPAPDKHVKNLFLSREDLNEVNVIDQEENGFDE